ncbi:Rad9/Ddc1, partial [Piptocephalis cylindrospora]
MHATFGSEQLKVLVKVLGGLARFGEEVILESVEDRVNLSTFNSSKSAFVIVTLPKAFFSSYHFGPRRSGLSSCRFPIKSLLTVFKTKAPIIPSSTIKEQEVEGVEWKIREGEDEGRDAPTSRLIILLTYAHGMSKVRELYFSEAEAIQGVFDPTLAQIKVKSVPRVWHDAMYHLHPKLEELTLRILPDALHLYSSASFLDHGQDVSMLQTHLQLPVVDLEELEVQGPE